MRAAMLKGILRLVVCLCCLRCLNLRHTHTHTKQNNLSIWMSSRRAQGYSSSLFCVRSHVTATAMIATLIFFTAVTAPPTSFFSSLYPAANIIDAGCSLAAIQNVSDRFRPTDAVLFWFHDCVEPVPYIFLTRENTGLLFERTALYGVSLYSSRVFTNVTIEFESCDLLRGVEINALNGIMNATGAVAFVTLPGVLSNIHVRVSRSLFTTPIVWSQNPFVSFVANPFAYQFAIALNVTFTSVGSTFTVWSSLVHSRLAVAIFSIRVGFADTIGCSFYDSSVLLHLNSTVVEPRYTSLCLTFTNALLYRGDLFPSLPPVEIRSRYLRSVSMVVKRSIANITFGDNFLEVSTMWREPRAEMFACQSEGDGESGSTIEGLNVDISDSFMHFSASSGLHAVYLDWGRSISPFVSMRNSTFHFAAQGPVRLEASDGRRNQLLQVDLSQIIFGTFIFVDLHFTSEIMFGLAFGANIRALLRSFRTGVAVLSNITDSTVLLKRVHVVSKPLHADVAQYNSFGLSLGACLVSIVESGNMGYSTRFSVSIHDSSMDADNSIPCPLVRNANLNSNVSLSPTNGAAVAISSAVIQTAGSIDRFFLEVSNASFRAVVPLVAECNNAALVHTMIILEKGTKTFSIDAGTVGFRVQSFAAEVYLTSTEVLNSLAYSLLAPEITSMVIATTAASEQKASSANVYSGDVVVSDFGAFEAPPSSNPNVTIRELLDQCSALVVGDGVNWVSNSSVVVRDVCPSASSFIDSGNGSFAASLAKASWLRWNASIAAFKSSNITNVSFVVVNAPPHAANCPQTETLTLHNGAETAVRTVEWCWFHAPLLVSRDVVFGEQTNFIVSNSSAHACDPSADKDNAVGGLLPNVLFYHFGNMTSSSSGEITVPPIIFEISNVDVSGYSSLFGGSWNASMFASAGHEVLVECLRWNSRQLGDKGQGVVGMPTDAYVIGPACALVPHVASLAVPEAVRESLVSISVVTSILTSSSTVSFAMQRFSGLLHLQAQCLDVSDDFPSGEDPPPQTMEESLDITMNMFRIEFGPEYGKSYRGAAVGYLFVLHAIVGTAIVAFVIVALFRRHDAPSRAVVRERATWRARLRMPGWYLANILPFVMQPLTSESIALLAYHSGSRGFASLDDVLGATGLLCCVGCVLLALWKLSRIDRQCRCRQVKGDGTPHRPYVVATLKHWLIGESCEWIPIGLEGGEFAAQYGHLFSSCRPKRQWWYVCEAVVSLLLAAVSAVFVDELPLGTRVSTCTVLKWLAVAISAVFATMAAGLRPYDTRMDALLVVYNAFGGFGLSLAIALDGNLAVISVVSTAFFCVSTALVLVKFSCLVTPILRWLKQRFSTLATGGVSNEPASSPSREVVVGSALERIITMICDAQRRRRRAHSSSNTIATSNTL